MVPSGRLVGASAQGCLAHLRRKFFEAQAASPEASKRAIDFILEVYKIEPSPRVLPPREGWKVNEKRTYRV